LILASETLFKGYPGMAIQKKRYRFGISIIKYANFSATGIPMEACFLRPWIPDIKADYFLMKTFSETLHLNPLNVYEAYH
jgi:hypothetical protein